MILLLLLLSSLLHTTTGRVYNVTPDDPNTTCHYCHNLQHYLLNTTKYFTSNAQLLFLPGLHQLHTNLIIQNVYNFSLIGSTTNGTTPDAVIQCNSSVGIVMTNITNLAMKNMVINNCTKQHSKIRADLLFEECYNVKLIHIKVFGGLTYSRCGLVAINILGSSVFTDLTSNGMIVWYDEVNVQDKHHKLLVEDYHIVLDEEVYDDTIINIQMHQHSYRVEFEVYNSNFSFINNKILFASQLALNKFENLIHINHCVMIHFNHHYMFMLLRPQDVLPHREKYHLVQFTNCKFHHYSAGVMDGVLISINSNFIRTIMKNCTFLNGTFQAIHSSYAKIFNTNFSSIISTRNLVVVSYILQLIGPVVFTYLDIGEYYAVISTQTYTDVVFQNYIEFSNSKFAALAFVKSQGRYIYLQEETLVNITNNTYIYEQLNSPLRYTPYSPCYFQFISDRGNLDSDFANRAPLNYAIVINNDDSARYLQQVMIHCDWVPGSAFTTTNPYDVYKRFIEPCHPLTYERKICYCVNDSYQDCHTHLLATIYPGQMITPRFVLNKQLVSIINRPLHITVQIDKKNIPKSACKLMNIGEVIQTVYDICSPVQYTIIHNNFSNYAHWCELFLIIDNHYRCNRYNYHLLYVNFQICPSGFVQLNGTCTCDPLLDSKLLSITTCDINHQIILRPANTWLSAITINNSHQYHISPHCPLQYCLPHSSQLNFSTPNSQCQFNRSGLLCGQCVKSFSTVFGSSQCQHCSTYYLFLIIPFAIAGLVLVLLLFTVNLTVTDGDINGFIFYVNIISINSHVFFPMNQYVQPSYIFVSIANLDLGIETCFYNGMDDYAKMWLQLAFPTYLIFIATSFIIASRHSTRIQRITACRALPVLATLFLLSYTKILRTVSSALFYYSAITHLPSEHTTLVWALDANIPLFGIRFTLLFVVCLLLFLVLFLFNAVLIFTKFFSQIKMINHFKPLIDAFQGPHKYYYWTGVQLVMRAVFYGLSALDRNINLTIGVILLAIISIIQTDLCPFRKKTKHYNELALLLNLLILYTLSFGDHEVGINIMITIGAVQLVMIIICHIITNVCGGVFVYTNIINTIVRLITRQLHLPQQIHHELNNMPPDNSYNYLQYKELFIGEEQS